MLVKVDHVTIISLKSKSNTDLHKEVDRKDLQLQMQMDNYQQEESQRAIPHITEVDKEVHKESNLDFYTEKSLTIENSKYFIIPKYTY